jgi:hypothetical protein
MQIDLIRTSVDHEIIRANPTPGVVHQTYSTEIAKFTRDQLCIARNEVIKYENRVLLSNVRNFISHPSLSKCKGLDVDDLNLTSAQQAILDEWDGRCKYWKLQESKKDLEAHNDEIALREEIIEALVDEGKARHVAANLTNTETKMLAEGRRLGII